MSVDHHEQLEQLVAGYVLGALQPEEAAQVDAHLDACVSCRELAGRLSRAVATVPLAAERVAPPPRLRARVLAAAAAGGRPDTEPRFERRSRLLPLPRLRRTSWPVPSRWASAALIAWLAAFALGTSVGSHVARPPATARTAQYELAGSGRLATAEGRVFLLPDASLIFVQFSGLPQPNQGRVYELWIIRPGSAPAPAGTFVPDSDGSKVLVVDRTFKGSAVMAVTSEPGPAGSAAPTEQPSMTGTVA
jgi:anti-sigma-K factor RskA